MHEIEDSKGAVDQHAAFPKKGDVQAALTGIPMTLKPKVLLRPPLEGLEFSVRTQER